MATSISSDLGSVAERNRATVLSLLNLARVRFFWSDGPS
jgi:hypothetical protein